MYNERLNDRPDVRHSGTLWSESFLEHQGLQFIAPSKKSTEDPHQLGWRCVRPSRPLKFLFTGMNYATAGGAVALATMAAALRTMEPPHPLTVSFADDSLHFAEALGLQQISDDVWSPVPDSWRLVDDCILFPLTRLELEDEFQTGQLVRALMATASILPRPVAGWDTIVDSLGRVLIEAVVNVLQHAYSNGSKKQVFVCMTVTPASHASFLPARSRRFLAPQELQWFGQQAQLDNHVLEVAVADYGHGVPRTLFRDAEAKLKDFRELTRGMGSAQHGYQEARYSLHQCLCKYAFRHDSTRKRLEDFPTPAASLNWRGLHRCFHHSVFQDGCLVLASGQGRAGYASAAGESLQVEPGHHRARDLPGTAVVLRLPIGRRVTSLSASANLVCKRTPLTMEVVGEATADSLLDEPHLALPAITSRMPVIPTYAILFPFEVLTTAPEQFTRLMTMIRHAPRGRVVMLLFADIPPAVIRELRATSGVRIPEAIGLPQVLCTWLPNATTLDWALVGHIPLSPTEEGFCLDLERHSLADISAATGMTQPLARELTDAFPSLFALEADASRLRAFWHAATLPTATYGRLLQLAFAAYMKVLVGTGQRTHVFGRANNAASSREAVAPVIYRTEGPMAIRLPTGRLVRSFISCLSLLHSNRTLKRACGQMLARILDGCVDSSAPWCLLADSAASYFVAQLLLKDYPRPVAVYTVQNAPLDVLRDRNMQAILFADAIFRGETTRRHVRDMRAHRVAVRQIVVVLDLRPEAEPAPDIDGASLQRILTLPFDPDTIDAGDREHIVETIEVDQITHVPFRNAQKSPYAALADTEAQVTFLEQNPKAFRHGFHHVGGRIHTVSLQSRWLVDNHARVLVQWVADLIEKLLHDLGPTSCSDHLVVFSRLDSAVGGLLRELSTELLRRRDRLGCKSVVTATVPAAPSMATPRQIFALEEVNLLADVESVGDSLFPDVPKTDFIGVYIDDAAVTANSLRDFITKAARLREPRPRALVAVTLVNRLSPGENRFFSTCRTLSCIADSEQCPSWTIEFRTGQLFRLQVKSTERETDPFLRQFLTQLDGGELARPRFVTEYLRAVNDKLRRAQALGLRPADAALIQHPFHAGSAAETTPSLRSVRIRHLLALHEQNEGVHSELLEEIHAAVQDNDPTFLAVLALEPYLLANELFSDECESDVRQLCLSTLRSSAGPELKSDALFVLAREPRQLLTELPNIIEYVLTDADLVTQVLSFLYAARPRDAEWHGAIRASVDAHRNRIPDSTYFQVCNFLDAIEVLDKLPLCHDTQGAMDQIHRFVAATDVHTENHNRWREMYMRMSLTSDVAEAARHVDARDVDACLRFMRESIAPAMVGLQYIASEHDDEVSMQRLQYGLWEAEHVATRIAQSLAATHQEQVPINDQLRRNWLQLCHATLRAMAPVHFLGSTESPTDPSVLETVMPCYVCMPVALLMQMSRSARPPVALDPVEPPWLVVGAEKARVAKVWSLLLDNVVRYGQEGTTKLSAQRDPSGSAILTLSNVLAPDRPAGTGHGIAQAQAVAQSGGFVVTTSQHDSVFRAQVAFRTSFLVHPVGH